MPGIVKLIVPLLVAAGTFGALTEGGPLGPLGRVVQVDLPAACRKANIASKGLGCCVFRALEYAGFWQNVPALQGMPEWMRDNGIPGGGWPEKVDQLIPAIAKARGEPVPEYVQHTGGDLEFLYAALASGRLPCCTYNGRDMHYRDQFGRPIAVNHMVNAVHLDPPDAEQRLACVLDNNFVGANELVWMTAQEFHSRWMGNRGGWAIALKAPRPPAPPRN